MAGIIGVDCSGSKTYLPLYIGAVYSKDRKNMEEIYKNVKSLAVKENKIFGYTREIKAVDLKSESTMQQIISEISKLKFNVLEINNNDFQELRKSFSGNFKWELKLESVFWFFATRKLLGYEPDNVFLDVHYTKPSDRKFFEFLLTRFSENAQKRNFWRSRKASLFVQDKAKTEFLTVSSKTETAVKLADITAGIIRKNNNIRKIYKNQVLQLNMKEAARFMNDIKKI